MPLHKISDFDADYRETIAGTDVKGLGVYTQNTDDKIGTVSDALIDDQGKFRYLIVDIGFWIFGKKVLLPIGRTRIDSVADRIYIVGLTRQQADDLPEYHEGMAVDYDYEENVRGVYRRPLQDTAPLEASAPIEASVPLDAVSTAVVNRPVNVERPVVAPTPAPARVYNRDTYTYTEEPDLYDTTHHDNETFRLYEERLIANKQRRKAGEVAIGKHVETETARVAIAVEKERVVVERVTPADAGRVVSPDATAFREGEVAHVAIYEETPEIRKETILREEVRVRKVVDTETVEATETIRREELDVDAGGLEVENRTDHA